MPYIDQIVLALLFSGTASAGLMLWRRGTRGLRFAASLFVAFYGVGLAAMLAGHCADIAYNVVRGSRSIMNGAPFLYDWRTYSLLLFGALLIVQGVRVLRRVSRLAAGDLVARAEVAHIAGVVLLIVAPVIPLHGFFGILLTAWSTLALGATLSVRRRASSAAERRRPSLATAA